MASLIEKIGSLSSEVMEMKRNKTQLARPIFKDWLNRVHCDHSSDLMRVPLDVSIAAIAIGDYFDIKNYFRGLDGIWIQEPRELIKISHFPLFGKSRTYLVTDGCTWHTEKILGYARGRISDVRNYFRQRYFAEYSAKLIQCELIKVTNQSRPIITLPYEKRTRVEHRLGIISRH
ncbi:hypothetical protein JW711_04065 [Candidatus Woesearchaeota archaeon]|nr:hypothetical protein [Candidatus Woesearchaeota archaeon]